MLRLAAQAPRRRLPLSSNVSHHREKLVNDAIAKKSRSLIQVNQPYRVVGLVLVFLVIASVVLVFVRTLVFDRPLNDRSLQQSLIAASVGVTVTCLIAWLLDMLQVFELRPGWSKLLWTVLVASVLGNSALVYKRFTSKTESISIACMRLLASSASDPLPTPHTLRKNNIFLRSDSFAFFVSMRDLQKNENGDYLVDFRYSFEDRANGVARFVENSFTGNAERLRSDPARKQRREEYQAIAPECVEGDTVQSAQSMRFALSNVPAGVYTLRITALDRVGANYAIAEHQVQVSD